MGHLRAITRSIGKDPVSVKAEFQRLLPVALANRQAKIASAPEGTIVDNRDVWGELLESDLIAYCQVMPHVIRLYLAVLLGTPMSISIRQERRLRRFRRPASMIGSSAAVLVKTREQVLRQ